VRSSCPSDTPELGTLGYHPLLLTLRRISSLLFPLCPHDETDHCWFECAKTPSSSASPTYSSSSSTSGGVSRERVHSPRAPIQAPAYPPPRVPMMVARRYRSTFGQRRTVPPSPQCEASESSEEDPEERDNTHTSSDTSHSSVDVSSVHAS
ncbi:hypothetical protein PIB30_091947, partial [Stylosanthes scabra]|nr:hypothetical protein [Stylosanthes scabra]